MARKPRFGLWAKTTAGVLVVLFVGWLAGRWWDYQNHVAQAERYLTVGLYEQAEQHYLQALKAVSFGPAARFGAEKTAFARKMIKIYAVAQYEITQELNALLHRAPDDTLLIVLDGDRYYWQGDSKNAAIRYRHAVELDPEFAEAYYRLEVLSEQAGNSAAAEDYLRHAAKSGQGIPAYTNNLAYRFLKAGYYEGALREYSRLEQYPLAALEAAKAYWALKQLDEAAERQQQAIRWLDTPEVANLQQNQGAWYFETPQEGKGVRLTTTEDKLCYAKLALATTRFLQGEDNDLKQALETANCQAIASDLKQILSADLQRYAEPRDELAERSRILIRRLAHAQEEP